MIRLFLAFVIFIHGAIHLLGFIKAFNISRIDHQLTLNVSRTMGILWLLTGVLFFILTFLYLTGYKNWYYIAVAGALISQSLIFGFWADAKAASLVNLLILTIAFFGYSTSNFEGQYQSEVNRYLASQNIENEDNITEEDLDHLPPPVRKYLKYVGVVGKPRIKNVSVEFEGRMRKKNGAWFKFSSSQYNFFDNPARFFFMKARSNGLPTNGYHSYADEEASMKIRLLSQFDVVDIKSDELFEAETVTFFNDMCVLAPGSLIDPRINWKTIDDTTAMAKFSNQGVSISATLIFNQKGQLVNFVSDDRYEISDMKKYRFSTPIGEYKLLNGYNLPTYGDAIWHLPQGDFVYGKFQIKDIQYNASLRE